MLTQPPASFSAAVVPPAVIVNVMAFWNPAPGAAMAARVAVPFQVPAKAAGMADPPAWTVAGGELAGGVLPAEAGGALLDVPLGAFDAGPRLSSRTPTTARMTTAAALPAARASPRRDRRDPGAAGRPGRPARTAWIRAAPVPGRSGGQRPRVPPRPVPGARPDGELSWVGWWPKGTLSTGKA